MIIGIPKETLSNECRVPLLPSEIKRMSSDNMSFQIEHGAGLGAHCSDISYEESGAFLTSDVHDESEIIIKINPPTINEINDLKNGSSLISLINQFMNHGIVKKLADKKI